MLRESEFIHQLRELLGRQVRGLDEQKKFEIIRRLSDQISSRGGESQPEIHLVPFVTGRRPPDEASYPGLGSSDHVALILGGERDADNQAYLLYRVDRLENATEEELARYQIRATLSFAGPWGGVHSSPLPGWNGRVVEPMTFANDENGVPQLHPVRLGDPGGRALVLPLSPPDEFLPGNGWQWNEIDAQLRERATDGEDPFTFGNLFIQQLHVELALLHDGVPLSGAETAIDVCDGRRFGSLYRRVVEKIIEPDTEAQARSHRLPSLDPSYHPWFPVLLIGTDKAELYMRALIEDIVGKKRHLTDPRWLLRVGLYLELLTCIGIFEAVKDDLGDLLTPAEREAYESSPWFKEIRRAVNVAGWKKVWALRHIVLPQVGAPRAGDVSAMNLLAKKRATLAFLEVHHEDLKEAIRLSGPNDHNAQETWHRVFRDAERAVLRKTASAFPELRSFPPRAQELILWHQRGRIRSLSIPTLSGWFGDQDGLYASACNQYRTSMNHVADWARSKGLMDHAGSECVPESVSLLRAFMEGKHVRLGQLQRRDGYAGTIDVAADLPVEYKVERETVVALLRKVPLFEVFSDQEVNELAGMVRPIELGPVERIIVQGRPGTSLFLLAEGTLEILVRQSDGVDVAVATLEPGAVFGEMSLLTGEPRSATVRSVDAAVVYEIGQKQLAPFLQARPATIDQLAAIMEPRLRISAAAQRGYESKKEIASLGRRIRSFLLPRAQV